MISGQHEINDVLETTVDTYRNKLHTSVTEIQSKYKPMYCLLRWSLSISRRIGPRYKKKILVARYGHADSKTALAKN